MTKAEQDGLARLAECRRRIDQVDLRLLKLLNLRTSIVEEIGRIKQALSLPIYEPNREDQVFANVVSHNRGPLAADAVRRVFERIIDEMRSIQREQMLDSGRARDVAPAHPEAAGDIEE
jgi:chorismate mutase